MKLSERVLRRLSTARKAKRLSQRELGENLGWSQSKVAKVFTGRVGLDLDVDAMCHALDISIVDAIQEASPNASSVGTPMELQLLQRIRQRGSDCLAALFVLLK